jgi:small subunit ribosomal protein S17
MVIIWNKSIKELNGEVVSDKLDTTRTILVKLVKMHPLYKKRFIVKKRYYAHDAQNSTKIWDLVKIREVKPISKTKRRNIVDIIWKSE